LKAERRANNARQEAERLTTAEVCRHSRFVVGGMDAQTANDHIPADGLIDDDTLAQSGETTFTLAPSPPAQVPGATASP